MEIPLDPLLKSRLNEGEAAVIQLAQALSIDQVLIDERKGRKIARDIYGLRTLWTSGKCRFSRPQIFLMIADESGGRVLR